jgi:DNA-binding NarL/FixJ family response regulator
MEKMLRREAGTREVAQVLTSRELEIVRLAASGLRNKEIANKLAICEGTVKIHLHNIISKLGAHNRTEAAARFSADRHAQALHDAYQDIILAGH